MRRRAAPHLAALLLAASALCAPPLSAQAVSGSASAGSSPLPPATTAAAAADDPLPPLQGHEAPEVFTIAIPDDTLIDRYVDGLLATRRDWLQVVLDRSARSRGVIARALTALGLPRELAFLPAVESGFQARAVSPRGAVGLWQLMKNTAAPYGLRMDQWLDERRDVSKATMASLQKLAENYAIFGDWYLALAAYNCGVGRLSGIVRRNPGLDFWGLRSKGVLPRETAAFVPQFLALARILGHAGRYGFDLPGWEAAPALEEVALDRCVDLRLLARASGAPLDDLRAVNPELNFLVTPPAGYGYRLKVPPEWSPAVTAALNGPDMPLLEFRVHVVEDGDTLSAMSVRYAVSVPLIQEFNPALNPRALRVGSKVLIPLISRGSSG